MNKVFRTLKSVIWGVFSVIVLLIIFCVGATTITTAPDNAPVYVDIVKGVYYAPPYLSDNLIDTQGLQLATMKSAHENDMNPDPECRDQGYFICDGRSLPGQILESIGLLKKNVRWDKDGNWLY